MKILKKFFKKKLSLEPTLFSQSCSLPLWLFIGKLFGKFVQHSATPLPLLLFPKSHIIMFDPMVSIKISLISISKVPHVAKLSGYFLVFPYLTCQLHLTQ